MIMRNIFKILFLLSIIAFFFSCEDEPTLKKPDEIIRGNWKLINEKTIEKNGDTISSISNYEECSIDDIYSFLDNEKLIIFDENMKCSIGQNSYEYKYVIREKSDNKNNFELIIFEGVGHNVVGDGINGDFILYDENSFIIKNVYGCGGSTMPAWCYKLREFKKE